MPLDDGPGPDAETTEQRPQAQRKRSYVSNGAWKELRESGETVKSVRCTEAEAQSWVDGAATIEDIE